MIAAGLAAATALLASTMTGRPTAVLIAVFGAGVSLGPLLPLAVSLAAASSGQRCDAAIAQLGVLSYAGLLAGPAVIGTLADLVTVPMAVAVVVVLVASIVVMVGQLLPAANRRAW